MTKTEVFVHSYLSEHGAKKTAALFSLLLLFSEIPKPIRGPDPNRTADAIVQALKIVAGELGISGPDFFELYHLSLEAGRNGEDAAPIGQLLVEAQKCEHSRGNES